MFKASISNATFGPLKARLLKIEEAIPEATLTAAEQIGEIVVSALHEVAPVRSGTLADSFTHETVPTGIGAEVIFQSSAYYANYVDRGHNTRPGPRQHWVEAQDYTRQALDVALPEIETALEEMGKEILGS